MNYIQVPKKFFIFFLALTLVSILLMYQILIVVRSKPENSIFLDELFTDILGGGAHDQIQVESSVLKRTIQFMIEERDEFDPEVVEFVRQLIVAPSNKPLKLTNSHRRDFSQMGQSEFVDKLLGAKNNGFFIEAGGFDGESHSNSLFFELHRNWTGIMIEPIPRYFSQILAKNRRVYAINACIARSRPAVVKFQVDHVLSGRLSSMSNEMRDRIRKDSIIKKFAYVPCFSINTILKAINVNRVDFFSLDVEGAEPDVIESIDFERTSFRVFSIECCSSDVSRRRILDRMAANGFKMKRLDTQDLIMEKKFN